jgi:uncharacterized protein YggE
MKSGITVSAIGSASAPPDRAMLTIGSSAVRPMVSEAIDLVDGRIRKLLKAVSNHGIEADTQTSHLSVWPETDRSGSPTGYRVRNMVNLRLIDMASVGELIAAAMTALGDSAEMHGLSFERNEKSGPEAVPRDEAWEAVNSKAAQLARLAGLTLGRPVSITESSGSQILPLGLTTADIDLASPVEPGRETVRIHLVVRFALAG